MTETLNIEQYKKMVKKGRAKPKQAIFYNRNLTDYKRVIFIDAGEHNGVCQYYTKENICYLQEFNFWELIDMLKSCLYENQKPTLIVIEDTTQISPVYERYDVKNKSIFGNIAQKVGANKQTCKLIISFCEIWHLFFDIDKVKPTKNAKISAEKLSEITGYKGRSNEHNRDAFMLLYRNYKIDIKNIRINPLNT